MANRGIENQEKPAQPVRSPDLWFREGKKQEIQNHEIHTTIRVGNRMFGTEDPKGGYSTGDIVILKIQKEDGTFDEWQTNIVISSARVVNFDELGDEDYAKALVDRAELESYYGDLDGKEATLMEFEYLEEAKSARDLVRMGVLKRAELPEANAADLGTGKYTLPLINEDYEALTPVMWNSAYKHFGLSEKNFMAVADESYVREILAVLRQDPDYCGGGAGRGFKDTAYKHMDELDPLASEIGSINFILRTRDGRLKGYNTDGLGYALSLELLFAERNEKLAGKKILVLGAGGTANSVVFALGSKGCFIVIANRSVDKAVALANRANAYFGVDLVSAMGEDSIEMLAKVSDVVVNVSEKGATGELAQYSALAEAKLPANQENISANLEKSARVLEAIPRSAVLSDINLVGGKQTPFLKSAQAAGFTTLDGRSMVVNQGVEAFWIMYGELLISKGITQQDVAKVMSEAARQK